MSYLQDEITEQPASLRRLLTEGAPIVRRIVDAIRNFDPGFVMLVARGSSDNAARYGQYLLGIQARLPVALATPSIHTLYDTSPRLNKALVLGISQSGHSEDIRRVLTDARAQGALTVSMTNDVGSPMAHEAEYHLPLFAGPELSVAATKSYTAQLTALAMLVAGLVDRAELHDMLNRLPAWMDQTLRLSEPIAAWAERYRYMVQFASIGRGYNYCTAFEISLKIKELCYITGTEYSEADFLHGPIAMIQPGFPVIAIAPEGKGQPVMKDLLARLHERKAECLVVSNTPELLGEAHKPMPIPALPEVLSPIVAVVPGQLLAMNLAIAQGHAIDTPLGLRKVTITT
ncbi:MAG TPA: SIS domain-containing protein [Aggregatilineales bacterium]|nr:SIS domain-containing protein [Aggregatilineales bacterium]